MSANLPEPVKTVDTSGSQNRTPEANLSEEFREFGRQLAALLRALRESPRTREVENQVTQSLRDMEHEVSEAMAKARVRVQEQKLTDTLKGAATEAADETQRGLARGLHMLNDWMANAVKEAEKPQAPESTPASAPESKSTDTHYDPGL